MIPYTARSPYARLRPIPIGSVQLEDTFWAPRRRLLEEITRPGQYRLLEETGRLDNFRRAGGKPSQAKLDRAIERVAAQLGHTPAISRKAYLDPMKLETYLVQTR